MFNPVFVIQAGEPDWRKKRGSLIANSVRSPKDSGKSKADSWQVVAVVAGGKHSGLVIFG